MVLMSKMSKLAMTALCAALVLPAAAFAHPKLLASMPAADATVAAPTQLVLRFSERLMPKLSDAAIVMTGMPGMANHAAMPVGGTVSTIGADGNSLVMTPKKALPAGSYRVDWHVVSTDTHRVAGTYAFSVR